MIWLIVEGATLFGIFMISDISEKPIAAQIGLILLLATLMALPSIRKTCEKAEKAEEAAEE